MRNLLLLLILLAGGMAGYMIGDYRGKEARKALELAIETGKKLEQEQQAAIVKLRLDLGNIDEKHKQELATVRQEYDSKSVEWQREKVGLTAKIQNLKTKYAAKEVELQSLVGQLNGATGSKKDELEKEIARRRAELGLLTQQIEGNACLKVPVPQSVHDALALKMTTDLGEKR